jgi:hypothetical protein
MRDDDTRPGATARLGSHFFTRLFAFGILAAISAYAVFLAASGSGSIYAG